MTVTIHPRDLVSRKSVDFHFIDDYGDCPACVRATFDYKGSINGYEVSVYNKTCDDLFRKTNLPREFHGQFMAGVLIHEIFHILNKTLENTMPQQRDGIAQYIWNVIVDSHDEHRGGYWYPVYSQYIRMVLHVLKHQTPSTPDTDLQRDLQSWYNFVRFGTIQGDPEFMSFAIPLALTGTRGSIKDALHSAMAVYEYLKYKYTIEENKQDIWNECAANYDGPEGVMEAIVQSSEEIEKMFDKTAGMEEVVIVTENLDDSFYTETVLEYASSIATIADRFSRYVNEPIETTEYDGDLLMDAGSLISSYMGSFSGEDTLSYSMQRVNDLNMRICVACDISGSTQEIETVYAQATVIFLAAFERFLPGIQTALIQFNSVASEIYGFGEDIKKGAIRPTSGGGTYLEPVVDLVETYDWCGADNLLIVITDGSISSFAQSDKRLQSNPFETIYVELVPNYEVKREIANSVRTTIKDLPDRVMNAVILKVLKHRGQR